MRALPWGYVFPFSRRLLKVCPEITWYVHQAAKIRIQRIFLAAALAPAFIPLTVLAYVFGGLSEVLEKASDFVVSLAPEDRLPALTKEAWKILPREEIQKRLESQRH